MTADVTWNMALLLMIFKSILYISLNFRTSNFIIHKTYRHQAQSILTKQELKEEYCLTFSVKTHYRYVSAVWMFSRGTMYVWCDSEALSYNKLNLISLMQRSFQHNEKGRTLFWIQGEPLDIKSIITVSEL